jgi:putative addiction module component (TIGR02574 family)
MDFDALEKQALELPARDRARLVQDLLESLDKLTSSEVRSLWLDESERRAHEIDRGEVALVSSESVAQEARALLK